MIGLYLIMKNSALFEFEAIEYFLVWLTIDVVIFFNMFSIKQVSIDEEQKLIQVSSYKKTEVIPFSDVEYVSGSRFLMPEQVWFRIKDKRIIVFMAKLRFSIFQYHRHPMVEELADLCGLDDY